MKSIRLIALSAILTIGSFSAITYTSCSKDECKGVTCLNGGTCSGGTCTCPTGYEGETCETLTRTKVIKSWTCSDRNVTSNEDVPTYTASIVAGTSVTDLKIGKFSDEFFLHDVTASINGNTITIPTQTPDTDTANAQYSVSGTGVYDPTTKKITWTYTLARGVNNYQHTGTWQ